MSINLRVYVVVFIGVMSGCGGTDAFWSKSASNGSSNTGTGSGTGTGSSSIDATGITQLTTKPATSSGNISTISKLSADGTKVIFTSSADYTGQNSDASSELFIVNSDSSGLTQLTDSIGATVNEYSMDLSSDGSKIVFASNADYLGSNSDLDYEIYIINSDGTGLAQLSDGSDASNNRSQGPQITANGLKIAFTSNADPLGTNTAHNRHIFTINSDSTGLTQITSFNARVSSSIRMSSDGSKIVFTSYDDVMGTGTDNTEEIFVINSDGTGLAQLTDTAHDSGEPVISGDGSVIAFTSTADLTGQNAVFNRELFMMNSDGSGVQQITQTSPFNVRFGIDLSDDGSTAVFSSGADLTGENPITVAMVYAYKNGTFVQVNPQHSVNEGTFNPSVSSDGSRVTFSSRVDYTGGNPNGNDEYYIATQY